MKNSNKINLISIVYLNESNPELDLEICEFLEEYVKMNFNATVKLQDYVHNEEYAEGCLTFSLSRRLSKQERVEIISEFETDTVQVQFHSVNRLF